MSALHPALTRLSTPRRFLDDAFTQRTPRDDRTPGGGLPRVNLQDHPLGPALLTLLGGHPAFANGPARGGQWGDYALDQEGLDAIITQLMEANNPNRPVPAAGEIVDNLPRRQVTVQNYLDASGTSKKCKFGVYGLLSNPDDVRGRECAVCKDTLLPSPDSSEEGPATLVKLPCQHEFHEDCIVPWLKDNSGTCPVCRSVLTAPAKFTIQRSTSLGTSWLASRIMAPGNLKFALLPPVKVRRKAEAAVSGVSFATRPVACTTRSGMVLGTAATGNRLSTRNHHRSMSRLSNLVLLMAHARRSIHTVRHTIHIVRQVPAGLHRGRPTTHTVLYLRRLTLLPLRRLPQSGPHIGALRAADTSLGHNHLQYTHPRLAHMAVLQRQDLPR